MADLVMGTSAQITPFLFETHTVRVIMRNGEPWFIAKDVCDALGYALVPHAMRMLDDDEKGIHILDTLGGQQKVSVINESGLFTLVLRSRKPEARKFVKWVTSEVLPSIRKTGSYGPALAQSQSVQALTMPGIDPAQLLLSGQCAPVPLTAAQQALVSDHAWKLAGEALKLIEQHLLRRVAYCVPGAHAHGATLADVDKAVSRVTLGQALTHHHQAELRQVLKTLQIAKSFADTALDAVQQAIDKNEGGAA